MSFKEFVHFFEVVEFVGITLFITFPCHPFCVCRICSDVPSSILCLQSLHLSGEGFINVSDLTLHISSFFICTSGPFTFTGTLMAGTLTQGRSQLSVTSSEKLSLNSLAAKTGSFFSILYWIFLHSSHSLTLFQVFICLLSVSPVIQQTMQEWEPYLSYSLLCPQHLAQEYKEPDI